METAPETNVNHWLIYMCIPLLINFDLQMYTNICICICICICVLKSWRWSKVVLFTNYYREGRGPNASITKLLPGAGVLVNTSYPSRPSHYGLKVVCWILANKQPIHTIVLLFVIVYYTKYLLFIFIFIGNKILLELKKWYIEEKPNTKHEAEYRLGEKKFSEMLKCLLLLPIGKPSY